MLTDVFWLHTRRSRIFFFLICSPLLIPLLCASVPLLCAAEIFSRLRSRHPWFTKSADEDDLRYQRCEEGCNCSGFGPEEAGLLQRYLEDQLILVRSVYGCGEEEEQNLIRIVIGFHFFRNCLFLSFRRLCRYKHTGTRIRFIIYFQNSDQLKFSTFVFVFHFKFFL